MKLCALFSGGKDSTMALYRAMQEHEIPVLLSMYSEADDSFMYHVPNIHLTEFAADALGIPLVKGETKGRPPQENIDLRNELEKIKRGYSIEGVCVGAVRSNYQHNIVSKVCSELGLEVYAPYWQKNHGDLIRDAIDEHFDIIVVAVAAEGLDESWLGRKIDEETVEELEELHDRFGVDVGGEGGEYETLVLDGPIYRKRIVVVDAVKKWDKIRGELSITKIELQDKQ